MLGAEEIRESRNDDLETELAGRSIAPLDQATQWPACIGERATFMAPFEFTRMVKHPYAGFSDEHAHITPVPFRHPAYSAATIPFRWMSRKEAWELGEEHDLDVDPGREPTEGWLEHNNWVQDHHNQRALLDAFFSAIEPERSLCFFYAKQTPMVDDADRVLVGAGRVLRLGASVEYGYSSPGIFAHTSGTAQLSTRSGTTSATDSSCPYHELLACAVGDDFDRSSGLHGACSRRSRTEFSVRR